jgi:hypothetical protein
MASITIRNLDDKTKERLRVRAAANRDIDLSAPPHRPLPITG